jgi:hypothetical protein
MIRLNKEFCEFYGAMVGDGCLSEFKNDGRTRRVIRIDGHGRDDFEYYKNVLIPIIKKIIGKKVNIRKRTNPNHIFIYFEHPELFEFLKNELDLPVGKKDEFLISDKVTKEWKLLRGALSGLMSTDGCFYFVKNNGTKYYPVIEISSHSVNMLNQLKDLLCNRDFRAYITYNKDSIRLNGKTAISKWVKKIGLSNPSKKRKYLYWAKLAL